LHRMFRMQSVLSNGRNPVDGKLIEKGCLK
jgi:hypothetical protein